MKKQQAGLVMVALVTILIIMTGVVFVAGSIFDPPGKYPVVDLEGDWAVTRNREELKGSDLPEIDVGTPEKGDEYVLERRFTGSKIPNPGLYFRAYQSQIKVYIDGELIYSQGVEAYQNGRMPGRTICFVPLPERYIGKRLRISITAAEPGAFTSLGPFTLGNQQDLFRDFMQDRQLPHLFGTFLTLFALFQFLMIPYLIVRNREMIRQFYSALFILAAGAYMLAFYNLFNLYVTEPSVNTFLEFLSIYGIPITMCGYLQYVLKGKTGKIYHYFTILDFAILGLVIALHFTNILHISESLPLLYLLAAIEVVPFVMYAVKMSRQRLDKVREGWMDETAEMLPLIGMLVFVGCAFFDMAAFRYYTDVLKDESSATINLAMIGGMLLALSQMVSFLLQGVSFMRTESSRQALLEVAHTDRLTGLANRAKFEQELKDRAPGRDNFSIFTMYIAGGRGDILQKTEKWAGLLKDVFKDASVISRIEDNEYAVIMDDVNEEAIDKMTEKLEEGLSDYQKLSGVPMGIAYGSSMSREFPHGKAAYDVYLLADKRMFDMIHIKAEGGEA